MIRVALLLAAVLGNATAALPAVSQQPGGEAWLESRGELSFSDERLARIDSAFARYIADGEVAGAVVLVLKDGEPAYEKAFGWLDREGGRRMSTDAIFRIASQTKAVTSVAIMALVEEGRLSLNDPVSRFIPQFARTSVAVAADSGRTVPATRQITIRDLLTHTAGISYGNEAHVAPLYQAKGLGPAAGFGWYTADKSEPVCATMERLAELPFVAQPGDRWVYGYNTDVLGCVVERASGLPLDEFFRRRITEPLKMHDTRFFLRAEDRDRLATVYTVNPSGELVRAPEGARGQGDYVEGARRNFSGGAGLLSTARDYSRFLQMVLNGGTLDGERILSPMTVDLMRTNQVGDLHSQAGLGFGLGFQILDAPGAGGRIQSPGTFGWSGAYGTTYLIDPEQELVLVFMIQEVPNRLGIQNRVPMLVYQALVRE